MNAPNCQVDFVLGHFIMDLKPGLDGKSLGTRYVPDTLKQFKTGLSNVLTYYLKRQDRLDKEKFPFFSSLYKSKQNKYARVPQEKTTGHRNRRYFTPEDMALRDAFLTQPLDQLKDAEDLLLIAGTAFLEGDMMRGTKVLTQIKRNYIRRVNDKKGNPMIVVQGNVSRKTMMGSSANYTPMNFKIRGEYEVKAISKMLDTLPPVGCG